MKCINCGKEIIKGWDDYTCDVKNVGFLGLRIKYGRHNFRHLRCTKEKSTESNHNLNKQEEKT